jgi:N-acyl homoserine lactone hydrolase
MKLFIIQTGYTKLAYGQFFGGLEGWSGIKGAIKFATDKKHYILVPIYCFLIEHPAQGLVLVDTGINWDQAYKHKEYYTGLAGMITAEDEYLLQPDDQITSQLQTLGYQCKDVEKIVLTHLHEDHIGGLKYFPHARVIVSFGEWSLRNKKIFGLRPQVYSKSIDPIHNWEIISYSSGAFYNFPKSQDLFNDGSILMLPTPGHSGGHSSIFLQFGNYQVLLCGDSVYTLRHLAVAQVRSIIIDSSLTENYIHSIKQIQELRKALPNLIVVPGHDFSVYHAQYLKPFFKKGGLSNEELTQIKEYEKQLFKGDYTLPEEQMPKFLPPAHGGNVGLVK